MFTFDVNDMTGCDDAVAIVKAVRAVDEGASVYVDMETRGIEVTSQTAGALDLVRAIEGAGYTPVLLYEPQPVRIHPRAPPKIPFDGADHDFRPG